MIKLRTLVYKIRKLWYSKNRVNGEPRGEPMYDAIDVARYIIKYSDDKEYGVSNLKLQKLLYFVQVYFLINIDQPAFYNRIEAWDFGPVVPDVYREFKQYGAGNIPAISRLVFPNPEDAWNFYRDDYSVINIKEPHKKMISEIVDELSDYSAVGLMKLTHNQDPWINAYDPNETYHTREITQQSIKEYFEDED